MHGEPHGFSNNGHEPIIRQTTTISTQSYDGPSRLVWSVDTILEGVRILPWARYGWLESLGFVACAFTTWTLPGGFTARRRHP